MATLEELQAKIDQLTNVIAPKPVYQANIRANDGFSYILHIQRGVKGHGYGKRDLVISTEQAQQIQNAIFAGGPQVSTSLAGSSTPYLVATELPDGQLDFAGIVVANPWGELLAAFKAAEAAVAAPKVLEGPAPLPTLETEPEAASVEDGDGDSEYKN